MNEEWRPIPGHSDYEVSDLGRVRSTDRWINYSDGRRHKHKGKLLHPGKIKEGYLIVHLGGKYKNRKVHHLVALAFIGKRPFGWEVCHNDNNKLNNKPDNLRYDTRPANQMDRVRHGTSNRGERQGQAKLTREIVLAIRRDQTSSNVELGRKYGLTKSGIRLARIGKRWSWLTCP